MEDEPLLRNHPGNPRRQELLDDIRDGLQKTPPSRAQKDALRLAEGMGSAARMQSWALLRDKLRDMDHPLAQRVDTGCESTHSDILGSANTGTDIIPMLHSICSNYVDAHGSLLDSWRSVLRSVVKSFGKGIGLDGKIMDFAVTMAKFGRPPDVDIWLGANAFAVLIEEVYARNGHYGEICDICEQILAFKNDEDAKYAMSDMYVELPIASLANYAIAQNVPDGCELAHRCADILKKRASDVGIDIELPGRDELTLQDISESVESLMAHRKSQNLSPWNSYYSTDYPLMHERFGIDATPHDSLPSTVETEEDGLKALVVAALGLMDAHINNPTVCEALNDMMSHVNKSLEFDGALQKYIIDMARFASGATDEMINYTLSNLCARLGEYKKICGICKEMHEFKGADAQRMDGSLLIEHTVTMLLHNMFNAHLHPNNILVDRCRTLLMSRSSRLCLGRDIDSYPENRFVQATLLASDIASRRRMRTAADVRQLVSDRYPLSYEFLCLGTYADTMIASKQSALANQLSDQLEIHDLVSKYDKDYFPNGALDRLEALLEVLDTMIHDYDDNSQQWAGRLRSRGLQGALLEVSLYVHCKAWYRDKEKTNAGKTELRVELHPEIDDERYADLKVGECYIEAYSPLDAIIAMDGRIISGFSSIPNLCHKIMRKKQIESFGKRQSMLVVECYERTFRSQKFRQLLKTKVQLRPSLGGILLVSHPSPNPFFPSGDYYETFFLRNDDPNVSVPKGTVKNICRALESKISMREPASRQ